MAALIRIDQAANPQPGGIAGRARKDLILGQPVTLRNSDDTNVSRHIWTMLDVPIGSSATLSSTSSPAVTFVPDVAGSYRVQLVTNDGLAGERDIRIAGVVDGFDRLYPAADQRADEANWPIGGGQLNENGWAKEVERILRSLGSPQLLNAAQDDTCAVLASKIITVGAIGLPQSSAEVVAYDFVDLNIGGPPNAGPPPTLNGETFLLVAGVNGLASIGVVQVDIDTSGTSIGDLWGMVMVTDTTPLLLSKLEIV